MYEYQNPHAGLGRLHGANVNTVRRGNNIALARAPAPIVGIDGCATGNCPPLGLGTAEGTNGRPWWQYALAGAGVGLGYMYLRRTQMMRNPGVMSDEEVIKQAAAITIQAGLPTLLWGSPGIGKTQWVQGLGKAMAPMNGGEPVKVITVIGSTKDPTDIGGMPTTEGGTFMPSWAKELRERSEKGLRSILFLDEFSSITAIVHASLLRVVNEKIAGDKSFDPKNEPLKGHAVHIVLAANPKNQGANVIDLPPPAANRIIHFEWPEPNAIEWADGMLFGWKSPFYYELPENWRESPIKRGALEEVAAFLKYREGIKESPILFKMPGVNETDPDHGGKKTGRAWPSPRSWDLAANALGATMVAEAPRDVQLQAVVGAVGVGAAYELFGFRRFENLPNPEDILNSPMDWDVPRDEIRLFIITGAVANAAAREVTKDRYIAAWEALAYAVDVTGEQPVVAMAGRQLMDLALDERYRKALRGWRDNVRGKEILIRFLDTLIAMGWLKPPKGYSK